MRRRPFGQGATCGQAFPGGVGSESINTGRYYQHSILSQREAFASLKSVFDGRGASELGRSRKEAFGREQLRRERADSIARPWPANNSDLSRDDAVTASLGRIKSMPRLR
jgi:hypothetical protein